MRLTPQRQQRMPITRAQRQLQRQVAMLTRTVVGLPYLVVEQDHVESPPTPGRSRH
jgi:hypothetical protein